MTDVSMGGISFPDNMEVFLLAMQKKAFLKKWQEKFF
jgi:hypothetical protein